MKINVEEVNKYIKEKFRNNKSAFAEEINVERSYFSRVLNNKEKLDSPKICNNILYYCNKNNLDASRFIIF